MIIASRIKKVNIKINIIYFYINNIDFYIIILVVYSQIYGIAGYNAAVFYVLEPITNGQLTLNSLRLNTALLRHGLFPIKQIQQYPEYARSSLDAQAH